MSTQQAAHFGTQTPAAYSQRGARLIIMACRLDRCGTLLPTDRDFHSAGGAFRHADVRGLFTAWRSAYYNGVSSRSLRRLPPADRDVHAAGGAFRHADARGGFRPANAAHTLPHFFPTCDVQEANLFIQVSVKSISASCRRTHRPSAPRGRPSSCGHRGGLLLIPFRSTAARFQRAFFSSSGSARPRRSARPPSGIRPRGAAPSAARRPFPTTSAAQSPESRLCGGLSASIHPLHPPIARAPRL